MAATDPQDADRVPLSGWGRYPVAQVRHHLPFDQAQMQAAATRVPGPIIARGLGRSYADPAIVSGGDVLATPSMSRLLDWDPETGILHCEAGLSLADIIDRFLPEGWFLPVTPGTKHVTVGGAVASDVHGKNHHIDGSFAEFVLDFRLWTPEGRVLTCSRTRNKTAFWATVGGMGLTGILLSVRFRLKRVPSAYFKVRQRQAENLDAAIDLFDETDQDFQYSVAWIDCLAKGDKLGRCVLLQGDPADPSELSKKQAKAPFAHPVGWKPSIPFDMPKVALSGPSMKAFNNTFYRTHGDKTVVQPLEPYFYPLDAVGHWYRMYGKRGFIQYQFVLPHDTSKEGIRDILERVSARGSSSFLTVLKRFGPGDEGYLSFPEPGYTLALDIPFRPDLPDFLRGIDARVLDYGGRTYLAKDAVLDQETFETMYPEHKKFRRVRDRLDPDGRLASDQARRIGLADPA